MRWWASLGVVVIVACGGPAAPGARPATSAAGGGAERAPDAPAPSPVVDVALVLDRSGSMVGDKIQAARDAARAAIAPLPPTSSVAVIAFDATPHRTVPLTPDRAKLEAGIASLDADGGTDILAALELAFREMRGSAASVRHVLLLTDGQSAEQGVLDTVRAMRASGISVSAVGLGPDANARLLERIATEGGGRAHVVLDPRELPDVFEGEAVALLETAYAVPRH